MFLFIFSPHPSISARLLFKYISCSYLSGRLRSVQDGKYVFKYISCSYLSVERLARGDTIDQIQIHLMFLFILYLLSFLPVHLRNSNTSHVLIYHLSQHYPNKEIPDSNTSHVLIYRKRIS